MRIRLAFILLIPLLLVSHCKGGISLNVSGIEGPDVILGGSTGEYNVSADSGTGISYQWAVDPPDAGMFSDPTAATSGFTASTVAEDLAAEIQAVVSSDDSNPVFKSREILIIHFEEIFKPPVASAIADPLSVYVFEPVHFTGSGSYDPDGGDIVLFEWDWENDGTFDSEGFEIFHEWEMPGIYHVQLRVTDDEGVTDELDAPLVISIEERIPNNLVDVTPPWLNFGGRRVVTYGNYILAACQSNGIIVFDVSEPSNPQWVQTIEMPGLVRDIAIFDSYACVADSGGTLSIVHIDPLDSASVVSTVDTPGSVQRIVTMDGYAYVAEHASGLFIVDVDPPETAHVVSEIPIRACDVNVSGGTAYLASGNDGLTVIDVGAPESPQILGTVQLDEDDYADRVAVSNGYAYLYVPSGSFDGNVRIVDIDPLQTAEMVGSIAWHGRLQEMRVSGDHLYISTARYCMSILNIAQPESSFIQRWVYVPGYAASTAISGDYAYIADSNTGLMAVDINPVEDAHVVNTFDMIGDASGIDIVENRAYVANSFFGLQVLDISSPESAHIVHSVDLPGIAGAVAASDRYACVASAGKVQIVDVQEPESARFAGEVGFYRARDCALSDGYACVAAYGGCCIIDIDPPESSHAVTRAGDREAWAVAISDNLAFVTNDSGWQIVDIDPPESPEVVYSMPFGHLYDIMDIDVSGDYVAALDLFNGLFVYDIDPLEHTRDLARMQLGIVHDNVAVLGGYAYVLHHYSTLSVVDIDPPESIQVVSSHEFGWESFQDITVIGQYAFIANGSDGLRIIRLW